MGLFGDLIGLGGGLLWQDQHAQAIDAQRWRDMIDLGAQQQQMVYAERARYQRAMMNDLRRPHRGMRAMQLARRKRAAACEYCGGHEVDSKGRCDGCGAPK